MESSGRVDFCQIEIDEDKVFCVFFIAHEILFFIGNGWSLVSGGCEIWMGMLRI